MSAAVRELISPAVLSFLLPTAVFPKPGAGGLIESVKGFEAAVKTVWSVQSKQARPKQAATRIADPRFRRTVEVSTMSCFQEKFNSSRRVTRTASRPFL